MQVQSQFSTSANARGFGSRELTAFEEREFAKRKKRALLMLAFLACALPSTLAILIHGSSAPMERIEAAKVDGVSGHYTFLGTLPHGEAWGRTAENEWRGRYKNGLKHGFFEHSSHNHLVAAGRYYEGKKDGFWRTYSDRGDLIVLERFLKGKLIRTQRAEDFDSARGRI